ncbi:hypothetical protein KUF71_018361 [Frankliniella fusca]|uniref:Uncharacterized protein n=1 Tax=Frankliniella fusca TaxID=407009 RepID=A0AAE1GTT2_9NEOP|nr:hypothetical protein KUF71_018361 [Frankliniella fusca]
MGGLSAGSPGPGPGRFPRGAGGARRAATASDSDPDQPDKLLFTREEVAARRARALASSSPTSTDSSLTFELSETPLPSSEERFILAEYAFSPGPSLGSSVGTSTTSSWTLTSSAGSGLSSAASRRTLRRACSEGDLPRRRSRGSLWDGGFFRPARKPSGAHQEVREAELTLSHSISLTSFSPKSQAAQKPAVSPVPLSPPPLPLDRGDVPVDVAPACSGTAPGRAAILLGLEAETKALMQAAMLGAVPLALPPRPRGPSRITSESSTQTNLGQSILQLDELFREHGIHERTLSRTRQEEDSLSQRPLLGREALASGDNASFRDVVERTSTTTTRVASNSSRVSGRPDEVPCPCRASWSTRSGETACPAGPASEDDDDPVGLEDVPLPAAPPPRRPRRRVRGASRTWARAGRRQPPSSSDSEAPYQSATAWRRLRRSRRKSPSTSSDGVGDWLSPRACHDGDDDTSSMSLEPPLPSPPSTTPPPSDASLEDAVVARPMVPEDAVVVRPMAPEDAVVARPTAPEDAVVARSTAPADREGVWEVSLAVSKSTVTVAMVRAEAERSVVYRFSLAWLLSELSACLLHAHAKTALPVVAARCAPAPAPAPTPGDVTRTFLQHDDVAGPPTPLRRPPKPQSMFTMPTMTTPDLMRPWHGDGAGAKEAATTPAAARPIGRGARGVAASKWTRKCRRRTTRALRELFSDGSLVSVLHRVRTAPGLPAPARGPAVHRAEDCDVVHSAPVLGASSVSPARALQRPNPFWSSTQLTLDRRKSPPPSEPPPPPPPPPPQPKPPSGPNRSPRRRGRKRSLSLGAVPQPKIPGSCPSQRVHAVHVEPVAVRRTAAAPSVSMASSSSDQCPNCDCWRPPPPPRPPPSPDTPPSPTPASSDNSDECPFCDCSAPPPPPAVRASEPAVRRWLPPGVPFTHGLGPTVSLGLTRGPAGQVLEQDLVEEVRHGLQLALQLAVEAALDGPARLVLAHARQQRDVGEVALLERLGGLLRQEARQEAGVLLALHDGGRRQQPAQAAHEALGCQAERLRKERQL